MIVGHLLNIKNELALYPSALQQGLKFLLETDLSALPLGRHEIQGNKMFASIAEYETEPRVKRRPERHEKYVDIQYICSGEETIGSAPMATDYKIVEDCLIERDVVFYKEIASETLLTLSQGMFAIYFPWDVHRPNCNVGDQSSKVRKIVVKIAVDLLEFSA